MHTRAVKLILLYCLLILTSLNTFAAKKIPVIAAAASTQFALEEIYQVFTQKTGLKVRISYGASGNLSRQIQQGAPFELFLSADQSYINKLKALHLTQGQEVIYANGRLVLFLPHQANISLAPNLNDFFQAVKDDRVQRFAIANPEHAPYGRAAKEILKNSGIWNDIKNKLILGENISQTAQFATSVTTQGGLISYSLSFHPAIQQKGSSVLIKQSMHSPFLASMILTKLAESTTLAFFNFLQSPQARLIFNKHGFILPNRESPP